MAKEKEPNKEKKVAEELPVNAWRISAKPNGEHFICDEDQHFMFAAIKSGELGSCFRTTPNELGVCPKTR